MKKASKILGVVLTCLFILVPAAQASDIGSGPPLKIGTHPVG